MFALAAWLGLRKVVGLEQDRGQLWLLNPSRAGLAVAQETAWALPLKMAVISALEGGRTSGIPHAQSPT